ncbi:phage tail length tape measure family protein [Pseudoxanthomonas winnipegensis]|uniref:Bacteriophage tail tape measure N-terminal domain-containing protein n=1 Tax=Pseudoxanthomonas winnipegensis TaxID=2480810 RepID=A0A4Q8LR27_9GAMM|nr:phage tail length tape measure family protein [Pseudoxanthomonas winnipegensis]RZZ84776.1 hypothetical protein EA663_13370 [Pseudoxanthomonas winnipegensis]TAA33717.1 hypothetical protein EA656_14865 [Pseudoxanthomonas winnipegensis]
MTDIAQLSYEVDSAGLDLGTRALDRHASSAEKAERGALKLTGSVKKVAVQAGATGSAVQTMTGRVDRMYQQVIDETQAMDKAMGHAGISAAQWSASMRMLPAQLTDIVTGLATGQAPFTVLIQQGGQLKDMFGGVVPAAKALAIGLGQMINPLTVSAAAVGALAYAWHEGESEARSFNEALILTGGYAGRSAAQLSALADTYANVAGVTQHFAATALAEVAKSGAFAGEQFDVASRAAVLWSKATGGAVDDTVKEFSRIKDDPVDALLTLNDSYHFLSKAQIDHIRLLEDEGHHQDAVTSAFGVYANMIDQRAPQLADNLGYIERAWRGIKDAAAGVADGVMGLGRQNDLTQAKAFFDSQKELLRLNPDSAFAKTSYQVALSRYQQAMVANSQFIDGSAGPVDSRSYRDQMDKEEEAERQRQANAKKRLSDQQREAAALAAAFDNANGQLAKQIALYGDTTNAARIAYEIQYGGLQDLSSAQKALLQDQASWLDWLDEMATIEAATNKIADEQRAAMEANAKKSLKVVGGYSSELTRYADQAARNMQDSFADFLFDPFAEGLDGMLTGFLKVIQRIAAEVAAEQILQGVGGWLGQAFGPRITGFSSGGYTGAGGKHEAAGIVHRGEYVINAESTRRLGLDYLNSLNGFASGGLVGSWTGEKGKEETVENAVFLLLPTQKSMPEEVCLH